MTYDLTDEVKAIGSLNFEGNITPIEWFSHIRLQNNKPDLVSIILLSDIVYWYRPTTLRDERSGKIINYKKKFKSDILQKSYNELEDLFGFSSKQIREAFIRLEDLGIIQRIFRTIESNGTKFSNIMFIKIFPSAIEKITNINSITIHGNTSFPTGKYPLPSKETPLSSQGNTNTETTTKITTNNILSHKKSENIKKETYILNGNVERENELLKIWNEVIESRFGREIKITPKRKLALKIRLHEFFQDDINLWKEFCQNILKSKFLMGEVKDFRVSLDWVLKEEYMIKVIEGTYHREGENKLLNDLHSKYEEQELIKELKESNTPEFWQRTMIALLEKEGKAIFFSWFKKNQYISFENGILKFKAFSKFAASWITTNYYDDLIKICNQEIPMFKDLVVEY